jgi:DNA-binding XRE family transcriptional regulator
VATAVADFLREKSGEQSSTPKESFVLDQVPNIDTLGDDLRDDVTGKLDAKKVSKLFKISLSRIAKAVGVSRQALDENPVSEKAQPLLQLFERIARLRSRPEISDPSSLRKWFRKPLPLFSGHSADELFQAGKLELVASKVDRLLTGDFGG